MSLAEEKMNKAMYSLMRAISNMEKGDLRVAKTDLGFCIDNALAARYLVEAELEDNENEL